MGAVPDADPAPEDDREEGESALVDEAGVEPLADDVAAVQVEVFVASGLPGVGDEVANVALDRSRASPARRGRPRVVGGDEHGPGHPGDGPTRVTHCGSSGPCIVTHSQRGPSAAPAASCICFK